MSMRDIEAYPVKAMVADDALLFLWRVASMQEEALRVVRAWGFVPKSEIIWVKTSRSPSSTKLAFGMGRYVRASHETCIVASRGKGSSLIRDRAVRSVFHAQLGVHSAKPDEFFALIERIAKGPRLELFARKPREGWETVGDQCTSRS